MLQSVDDRNFHVSSPADFNNGSRSNKKDRNKNRQRIAEQNKNEINNNLINKSRESFSIAIHSRHARQGVKGTNVKNEINCLSEILSKYFSENQKGSPSKTSPTFHPQEDECHIYIMSDRPITVQSLSTYVKHRWNCTPHVANHTATKTSSSFRKEHGPFSGTGYFRDLGLATGHDSSSRNYVGFIGTKDRSSSLLFLELIEYDRKRMLYNEQQEQRRRRRGNSTNQSVRALSYDSNSDNQDDGTTAIKDIPTCWLPKDAKD